MIPTGTESGKKNTREKPLEEPSLAFIYRGSYRVIRSRQEPQARRASDNKCEIRQNVTGMRNTEQQTGVGEIVIAEGLW